MSMASTYLSSYYLYQCEYPPGVRSRVKTLVKTLWTLCDLVNCENAVRQFEVIVPPLSS